MITKHHRIVAGALLAAPVLALLIGAAPAHAQFFPFSKDASFTRTNPSFLKAFKEVVAKPSASTVRIQCDGKDTALGMVVGPDGWILTKANDLKGDIAVKLKDGKTYEARWVGVHQKHDVALLKIEAGGLKPVEFTDSKQIGVGNWLACAGTTDDPVAVGVVSVATRTIPKGAMSFFQANSKTGFLGVELEQGDGHPLIKNVQEGTAAFKVGLKNKDLVLALNGTTMTDMQQFIETIGKHKPGDVVTLKVRRGDVELELKPTLGRRPLGSMRGEMQNRMGSELSSRISGYPTILQHDSVIKPTDCGGPIVDLDGRVIGINICRAGRTESWAVPSEVIQPLLFDMMAGKLPPKLEVAKLTLEQQLAAARKALQKAVDQKAAAEKKLAELKTQVAKLEADVKAAAKPTEAASGTKPKPAVAAPAAQSKNSDSAVEVDKVLDLIRQRLLLMKDVAGAKWRSKQTEPDAKRETELLDQLVRQGEKLGLPAATVRAFFVAQFDAAKQVQQAYFERFDKEKTELNNVRDLQNDLRPKLDQVSQSLLTELGKLQPHLANPAVQQRLRDRAAAMLTGEGITDAVRNRALASLVRK
ncbi:MAG: gamma subclass chorismate mutase AroQ [Gemmataceae bacterium]|nr:gamma subclass chorismate mutase AroQ [Gemmataceae bacterium]